MTRLLNKSMEKGNPNLNLMFNYNMPFRGIAKMTGGMCTMEMAEGILIMVNGHFFKGLGQIIGNALEVGADGAYLVNSGLAFTLANLTAIFFGECINFPLQRNVTFKSHGPLAPQIGLHLLATIAVFLVMNLFTLP